MIPLDVRGHPHGCQDRKWCNNSAVLYQGTTSLAGNTSERVWQSTHIVIHSQNILPSFSTLQFVSFQRQMSEALCMITLDGYSSTNVWLLFECMYTTSIHTTPWQGISCDSLTLHWMRSCFLFLLFGTSLLLSWHDDQFFFSWNKCQTAIPPLTTSRSLMVL